MKLIVGIDFGTTYTGVAFAFETAKDPKEIKIFTDWPGALGENNEHNEKTPSRIAYAAENEDLNGQDAWGYEVEPGARNYSWTKLLLDNNTALEEYAHPSLATELSLGMLRLPPGKTAAQVVTDYLTKVHDHIIGVITEKSGGPDLLEVTPIEYWLTVPAIWSDAAKMTTRQAALDAGFGRRKIDQINLVPEPEAAAVLTIKNSLAQRDSVIQLNSGVVVCDCGGGTVDLTSYTITQVEPSVVLNESGRGTGAKCGGSYIDRKLHSLLTSRFGTAFSSLPYDRVGPGSRFMAAFESRKQQFSLSNARKTYKLPLKMPDLEREPTPVPGYDKRYSEVILTESDMVECFESVSSNIVGLLGNQIEAVKMRNEPKVKTVVLVGGLGCSRYVRDYVNSWCEERGVRMITPWSGSWSAVARGAVLHGLGAVQIDSRILRRSYGVNMSFPYRPGVDSTSDKYWQDRYVDLWDGTIYIPGQIKWLLMKDTAFNDTTEIKNSWIQWYTQDRARKATYTLFSFEGDHPPRSQDDPGVKIVSHITIRFDSVSFKGVINNLDSDGQRVWRLPVDISIKLSDRQGVLTLKTKVAGQNSGTGTLDFSEH